MTIATARAMIDSDGKPSPTSPPAKWADLGCGAGTFTLALADLLPPGSTIFAVDRDAGALEKIPAERNGVRITRIRQDFTEFIFNKPLLNGVLLANALHFVAAQPPFLAALRQTLTPGGAVLLVEYDIARGSRWVPYPLPADKSRDLFAAAGFGDFRLLGRQPSRFGPQELYAAQVKSR